ncbi:MAG: NAD(P)/FAD-dependent oxidoreductase [Pseudomonadota bacterium]
MVEDLAGSGPSTPTEWDVIVIGSGMGGMAAASALAQVGNRVLLLEQHQSLGGLTHSFSREGFTWDVGVHYLSSMSPDDLIRQRLDALCDTPMEFVSLGAVYDYLHIRSSEPLALSRPYEAQERDLKDRFPDEAEAIEAWTVALREGRAALYKVFPSRSMPESAGDMLDETGRAAVEKYCLPTTQDFVDTLTDNPELAAAMTAQWGDHGGRPSKASFAMHAMIAGAYLISGSWYPAGGAAAYAEHMIPAITKNGGQARAGVRVEKVLIEDGKAVGVRTSGGEEIRGGAVVSDIGARETLDGLLPDDAGHEEWIAEIRALPSSIAHFNMFLGFEGDIQAAGATKANHWLFPAGKTDVIWTNAPDEAPPQMTVGFGSLKNPSHDPGPRQKHTGQLIVWADWSTVARWAGKPPGQRGGDYADFKQRAADTLMAMFEEHFPDLAKLVVYKELATPLSTVAFTGHRQGAFYGLDVTPGRVMCGGLRATTPIPGLFLTGQDVCSPGIPGALMGGLMSAASVDPRAFEFLK